MTEPEIVGATTDPIPSEAVDELEVYRRKYRDERDKRLQTGVIRESVAVVGGLSPYASDPWRKEFRRKPRDTEVDVAIIGAGFGGLLAAARLRQGGVKSICLIDKATDVGGTWYWNRYPGVRCDVESYIYMPLLEEVDFIPSEKYATGAEIFEHARRIARHFDLYSTSCLGAEAQLVQWVPERGRWRITTDVGDHIEAQFVCSAIGSLHRPKIPAVEGLTEFEGKSFHSSRWNYGYTGGEIDGNLEGLEGQRVGVIGTGATGLQIVPELAKWASHVFVFQRTPPTVGVRGNRPTEAAWVAALEPGWQQRRMDNFHQIIAGMPVHEDLVDDGWTQTVSRLAAILPRESRAAVNSEAFARSMELADLEHLNALRRRVDELVRDAATAELLKPYYRLFCKRPGFHDEYLQAFNRENVTLVDTQGRGIDRLDSHAVVVRGLRFDVDCLVFATGFVSEFDTSYEQRALGTIQGQHGESLSDSWADGPRTLFGVHVPDFPNFFMMSKLQAGVHVNVPHMLDEQAQHIAAVVCAARIRGAEIVEPTSLAVDEWVGEITGASHRNLSYLSECTPGLFNNEGAPASLNPLNSSYGGGSVEYVRRLRNWRAEGGFAGLTFTDYPLRQ